MNIHQQLKKVILEMTTDSVLEVNAEVLRKQPPKAEVSRLQLGLPYTKNGSEWPKTIRLTGTGSYDGDYKWNWFKGTGHDIDYGHYVNIGLGAGLIVFNT